MCVWVLHLGLATIPGAKTWAPLSTALPHWAPTTTSELSCFTGLRTQETERSHTLHPPHRTPWDCNLARRVWILETQHILACTDYNYSQLLLNYSCLTLGVFLYIHLTIKCKCANLFCGFTVFFFSHLFGIEMLSELNLANETCYVFSSVVTPWDSMWVLSSGNTRPAVAHTTAI